MSNPMASTPTVTPPHRAAAEVDPVESYRPTDPVWVYRDGWQSGVVEAVSPRAVTVSYRPGSKPGIGVDTFTAPYITVRADRDPLLERRLHRARQGYAA